MVSWKLFLRPLGFVRNVFLELRRHEDFGQILDLIERAGMVEIVVKKNIFQEVSLYNY